ncbi:DUF4158 domain-containing protein [Nonomuraea aurantiaca]|uniref:DUF4158 domain-containing protein n=1 Tax=Nonomuraea aurantiaca TaxID=2878562 RepID=UPI001CDA1AE0|nr:DUF4158 domain-containing protein [Nonomuraea aurantiaca]
MPVSFLPAEQRSRYGTFNTVPDFAQLGAFFHLDADDRRRAMAANGARNQLGWSVQLGQDREHGPALFGAQIEVRFISCTMTITRRCGTACLRVRAYSIA